MNSDKLKPNHIIQMKRFDTEDMNWSDMDNYREKHRPKDGCYGWSEYLQQMVNDFSKEHDVLDIEIEQQFGHSSNDGVFSKSESMYQKRSAIIVYYQVIKP